MTMKLIERPSPNFDAREGVPGPDILVLHYTGMKTCAEAVARLTDPASKVSAHYTVDEDGTIYAHVPEEMRAWHAGVSSWRGLSDVNTRSIGIEIVNPGHEFGYRPFPEAQIAAVIELGKKIAARHRIPPRNVVGHSDVAPDRKEDPGELFPWKKLAAAGLGLWVEAKDTGEAALALGATGDRVIALQGALSHYGYGVQATGQFDAFTRQTVIAFQRHFRPARFDGVADGETQAILRALIERVDAGA
jgi:N-acetylmuramoyl-L-alanine amidase